MVSQGILGSEKRAQWWQGNEPSHMINLAERPDFTGNGGDACDYAWFCWDLLTKLKPISVALPWEGFEKQMRLPV